MLTNFSKGVACGCPSGMALGNDSKTCEDINECLIPNICSQKCVNVKRSYRCYCDKGYILRPNKKTCTAVGKCICCCQLNICMFTIERLRPYIILIALPFTRHISRYVSPVEWLYNLHLLHPFFNFSLFFNLFFII